MKRVLLAGFVVALGVGTALGWACGEEPPSPSTNAAPTKASGPGAAASSGSPTNAAASAPPAASTLSGKALADAANLFNANCASCHMKNGAGEDHHRKDGIPDFRVPAWRAAHSEAELIGAVTNGQGKIMPAFKGKLTDEQIRTLVAYVRTFPDRTGPEKPPVPPSASSSAKPGAAAAAPDHDHMHHP